jgi:uncharacterized protein DUF5989
LLCSTSKAEAGLGHRRLVHFEEISQGGKNMNTLRNSVRNLGVAGELLSFFWSNKRWWLVPMLFTLFLFGLLIVLGQSSAIAPFIYTLF